MLLVSECRYPPLTSDVLLRHFRVSDRWENGYWRTRGARTDVSGLGNPSTAAHMLPAPAVPAAAEDGHEESQLAQVGSLRHVFANVPAGRL